MLDIQKKLSNTFYGILALPATAMGFALAVQIAALSWILRTQFNLEIYEIGFVWAAGPLAGIFGQVIVGVVSDAVWFWNGRRRPFILIGGTLAALMLLALPNMGAIADFTGIANLVAVALVVALTLDLAINISFNPTRSIIADVTPEGRRRTKGYTWMQTISGFFGVAAYVAGALFGNFVLIYSGAIIVFLFSVLPPFFIEEPRQLDEEETGPGGRRDPILASTISILIPGSGHVYARQRKKAAILFVIAVAAYAAAIFSNGLMWAMFVFYTIAILVHLFSIIDSFRQIGKLNLSDPEVKKLIDADKTDWGELFKLYIAHGFSWLGVQAMFVYIIIFLEDQLVPLGFENTERMIGISFAVLNTIGFIFPVFVLEPVAAKIGRVKTHMLTMAIMSLSYFGMAFLVTNPMILYVLMGFAGIGWAAVVSLPFAIMSEKVNKNRMGFFMGIFNLSVVIPHLIVSLVFGFIIESFPTKDLLFVLCGVMLALSAISWFFVEEKQTGENGVSIPGGGGH